MIMHPGIKLRHLRVFLDIAARGSLTAAARAQGVTPRGFGEFRPEAFRPGAPEEEGRAVIAWLADYTSRTAKTHSGIWRDLAVRKRRTEVDPHIGVIRTETEVTNQDDVPVMRFTSIVMMLRRPDQAA